MSAVVLVSGRLQRNPERKTSKSGKAFVAATLREGDGDSVTWWSILSFSETANEELLTLKPARQTAELQGQSQSRPFDDEIPL